MPRRRNGEQLLLNATEGKEQRKKPKQSQEPKTIIWVHVFGMFFKTYYAKMNAVFISQKLLQRAFSVRSLGPVSTTSLQSLAMASQVLSEYSAPFRQFYSVGAFYSKTMQ